MTSPSNRTGKGRDMNKGTANFDNLTVEDWRRWRQLLARNAEWARRDCETPEQALEFIEGFINGNIALIVPPDMIPPDELAAAIKRGQELAQEYGW